MPLLTLPAPPPAPSAADLRRSAERDAVALYARGLALYRSPAGAWTAYREGTTRREGLVLPVRRPVAEAALRLGLYDAEPTDLPGDAYAPVHWSLLIPLTEPSHA